MLQDLEIVKASIPLDQTDPAQEWIEEWGNQLFIKIKNSENVIGWGEILPAAANSRDPYVALLQVLSDIVISSNEMNIREIWNKLRRLTFSGGYGITTGTISGIDIALWDLLGKVYKIPLSRILGKRQDAVQRYASLSRYSDSNKAIKATESLLFSGYRSIKLHQTSSDTLETVKAVRDNLGYNFDLMVDLNCSMNFDQAKEFMVKASRYELKWVEEPMWPPDDFDSLKRLNEIGPVAAGENFFSVFEFKRLLENNCLTFYQPDVTKIGGITPFMDLLALFKTYGVTVAFHNRPHNGWIGIIASANLGCAYDGNSIVETPPNEIPKLFDFYGKIDKNTLTPDGYGIGIEPAGPLPVSDKTKILKFH